MTVDWDAATYDRIADPQARWGAEVLARLPLKGDETVLDAGCGSGRVTALLCERLPRGRVMALDASPSMLAEARRRLAPFGDRVSYVRADLARPLPLTEPVDAILSTATFHWVPDHDTLFANLASVLRAGGRLEAQCGGQGNIASVARALAEMGHDLGSVVFAGPDETRSRLAAAGFVDVEAWLADEVARFPDDASFATFLATVVLRQHLPRLHPNERGRFVTEVARRMGRREIDYVRLNIRARRGTGEAPEASGR